MSNEEIWTEANQQRYEQYLHEAVMQAYRVATILPMCLYPLGVVLDWFTHREYFFYLTSVRLSSALGCGFMGYLGRYSFIKKYTFPVMVFYFSLISLSITSMCLMLEGYKSPYYAGINLVLVVAGILMPKTSQIFISSVAILLCYYVPILIQAGFKIDRMDLLVNNSSFYVWTTFLVLGCGWQKERLLKESFSRLLTSELGQQKLAVAHAKLQEAEEQRSRFFANISHEFRTPLTLILEHARKTLGNIQIQGEKKSLSLIVSQSRLILRHVNDLLEIAKVEAGRQVLAPRGIDLAAHLRRTVEMFNVVAAERNIEFHVNTPAHLPAIVDADKIERIALNLVSNAFKFCPDGSTISCSLEPLPGGALLVVEDNGSGVPAKLRDKIFDRFHQGEAVDTRQHGGTGLGLAIVKEFAELHNGRAWVEEAKNGGAKFKVELKFSETPVGKIEDGYQKQISFEANRSLLEELLPQKRQETFDTSQSPMARGEKPLGTILIIEDSPDLNHFLASSLSSLYKVETAYDGQEGLEKALAVKPDLILCDVMMPRLSGPDVLLAVRQNPDFKNTPFIILTAKADDELRIKVLTNGADDYIMKPFVITEVLARVKNHLTVKLSRDTLLKSLELQTGDLQVLSTEIVKQKSQLEHLCECLEMAKHQAELSYRAKSRFLSLVSHEFRTPVTIFKMSLELLKRQRTEDLSGLEKREFERAHRASVQLVQLVETVLAYSQFENGDLKFKIETFETVAVVQELVEVFGSKAQQKGLKLLFNHQATHQIFLQTDSRIFRLILLNLIENAIKYTFAGSVEISCVEKSNGVAFAVKDTGLGIPQDKQRMIFEPFEQVYPTSVRKPEGLGLGLSLVKELLNQLEGSIELQSAPEMGSTFQIFLPYKLSETVAAKLQS